MIEVNLHPSGDKQRRKTKSFLSDVDFSLPDLGGGGVLETARSEPWKVAFLALFLVVGLFVGVLWFLQSSEFDAVETRLEEARSDSARLADLRELSDSLTSRQDQIRSRVRLVEELDRNRFVWPHLMDEIAGALPSRAWLRALKKQGSYPNLGVQIIGTAARPLIITDFVRNLESSPFISDVQIVGSNKQQSDGLTTQSFTLDAVYSPPPQSAVERVAVDRGGG